MRKQASLSQSTVSSGCHLLRGYCIRVPSAATRQCAVTIRKTMPTVAEGYPGGGFPQTGCGSVRAARGTPAGNEH